MSPRGRPSVLRDEHVAIVMRLRACNPGVGLSRLRQLVARECGLDEPPSQSALHRFMQRHGIRADAYRDLPTENALRRSLFVPCRSPEAWSTTPTPRATSTAEPSARTWGTRSRTS